MNPQIVAYQMNTFQTLEAAMSFHLSEEPNGLSTAYDKGWL